MSPTFGKRPGSAGNRSGIERRRYARQRTSEDARIILDDGKVIKCTVSDVSATGALLVVTSILGLPLEFTLQHRGEMRRVEVKRRSVGRVGVRFI
jgi:hypothetical protein